MRYKAWGEVRYESGTTPTDRTYTGQRSYTDDFDLMFYNARWYDSSIGRFAQADTIVPSGFQGLDRYAYVSNSPIRYTDPSGHCRGDKTDPDNPDIACWDMMNKITSKFKNMHFVDGDIWSLLELTDIYNALADHAFASEIMKANSVTFRRQHCPDSVMTKSCPNNGIGGMTARDEKNPGNYSVYIYDAAYNIEPTQNSWTPPARTNFIATVVHELTHVAMHQDIKRILGGYLNTRAQNGNPPDSFGSEYDFSSYKDTSCQQIGSICQTSEFLAMASALFQVSPASLAGAWQSDWVQGYYDAGSPYSRTLISAYPPKGTVHWK